MSDTRKYFDSWWYASKYMQVVFSSEKTKRVALDGWQACQQLNDKRIADLLALVAKKDGLINECIENNLYLADGDNCTLKPIIDALALTFDDVELVEVGVVCFEDTLVGVDLTNPTVKHGDKCYTIKQKGKSNE